MLEQTKEDVGTALGVPRNSETNEMLEHRCWNIHLIRSVGPALGVPMSELGNKRGVGTSMLGHVGTVPGVLKPELGSKWDVGTLRLEHLAGRYRWTKLLEQ